MRRTGPLSLIGLLAIAAAGCGTGTPTPDTATHKPTASSGGSFAWLARGPAPPGWPAIGVVAGGALPRPPGWRALNGDRGSVSFAELGAGGRIVGYLNATPRSGAETIANWTRFRVRHNVAEGDRDVRTLAGLTALRVGAARASCVTDDYRTSLSRYRELACLIARPRASTVVLGAAPPSDWATQRPTIERAIAGFVAS